MLLLRSKNVIGPTQQTDRPVSLTSILCKTMEHIMFCQVMNHLDQSSILLNFQHGFRANNSCETHLLKVDLEVPVLEVTEVGDIKESLPTPPKVTSFFVEKGLWKGLRSVFDSPVIHGCSFHFKQALYK